MKIGLTVLLLSALFWAPGVTMTQHDAVGRLAALESAPVAPASVTVPEAPVVASNPAAANSFGVSTSQLTPAPSDLTGDLLAAYTLAVAVSPTTCHITTPVLAAIGQVESGNLAGYMLDGHKVSPAILGPVLDGKKYRAVADTDAGAWDGNTRWDRALGPMQIIPSSWRVVGVDMDGDGVRDPQNIYDSAGAAMAYLCAGGRDLATPAGLRDAVLSYNRSPAYLRAVLAWTSVFEKADLTGTNTVPFEASLEVPSSTTTLDPVTGPAAVAQTKPAAPVTKARPVTPGTAKPSPSAAPSSDPTPSSGPTAGPSTDPGPTTPGDSPSTGTPGSEEPTPSEEPTEGPTKEPTKPADPEPLPECPVPTSAETTEPGAEPTAGPTDEATAGPSDDQVVSPETCKPPKGYVFDPDTGELVPEPVTEAP